MSCKLDHKIPGTGEDNKPPQRDFETSPGEKGEKPGWSCTFEDCDS